jgi:DNA repair protein RadA/Sms
VAKPQKRYVCQACGAVASKWQGQCVDCGDWNTLVEDAGGVVTPFSARHNLRGGGQLVTLSALDTETPLPSAPRPGSPSSTARSAAGWWRAPRR